MTPHKHAALIKAWADGAEIQFRFNQDSIWQNCVDAPTWRRDNEYRVKPKTIRYRLALVAGSAPYILAINEGADLELYKTVKWLGDWQEVEI